MLDLLFAGSTIDEKKFVASIDTSNMVDDEIWWYEEMLMDYVSPEALALLKK